MPLHQFMQRHRLDLALAALLLTVVAPFVQPLTAQSSPRYALSSAIVEKGTIRLDDYEAIIGVDRVEIDGHLFADKAPGQPMLGVPIIAASLALGADPATEPRVDGNLGAWSLAVTFCSMPAAVLVVLMRRHSARSQPARPATIAACALAFSTMLLPFASSLYAHVFVASLSFGAWHLLTRADVGRMHFLGAGLLMAVASASEYPMLYAAGVFGVWALFRHGFRSALLFGSPHIVIGPLVLAYHRAAYGTFSTGYSSKEDEWELSYGLPKPSHVVEILVGSRGFVFTPIVLVAMGALVVGLWHRRFELLVPAAVFGGFFALQAGWPNPWGGDGPGPRYIAPALPFLVVPAAMAIGRLPRYLVLMSVAIGATSMGLVLVTFELIGRDATLIERHLRYVTGEPGLNPTVFTIAFGTPGWLLHGVLVALAACWVASSWPSRTNPETNELAMEGAARPQVT